MELIKSAGRRTRLSEVIYIILNLLLPVALFALTAVFNPWVAVVFLALSKWRVFAVRPRYWFAHIKSNLIDLTVGLSYIFLLKVSEHAFSVQAALVVLYMAWLLYIKPKSQRHFMAIQAGVGLFLGLTALMGLSFGLDSTIVVLLGWLVGYTAARHLVSAYEEDHPEAISFMWGLLVGELAWLGYHWTISYPLIGGVAIPQIAAIVTVLGFGAYNLYDNYKHARYNPLRVRLTVAVSLGLLAILLVFSRWSVAV